MNPSPIHEALGAVRHLREALIEKQRFTGYSGPVRMTTGVFSLVGAFIMGSRDFPVNLRAHLIGWGVVFLLSSLANLGAIAHWFLNEPRVRKHPRRLKPVLDFFPPLLVGAVLTALFVSQRQFDALFGTWMCMFGLTNLASRYVLPPGMILVGLFYITAGVFCLFSPSVVFTVPWPMGLVFFTGEMAGGAILYLDRRRYASFEHYALPPEEEDHENPS